jgi:hypothetical protein
MDASEHVAVLFFTKNLIHPRPSSKMPARASTHAQSLYNPRRHIGVHAEHVSDVSSTDFPGHYADEDNSWDLVKFKKVRWRLDPKDCQILIA